MAIADSEPKKGEVDVTSTGSSSSSKEMKKPRVPIKYSSLKDFSFSVSDVWDDRNIGTFIECCHEHLNDLKCHNGSEENKVWEKIAKSGLEKSGSVNCFNVNYCLELAKCLKSFVSKNEKKMMDNEIFKSLYENVVDLLPYFAPVSSSRHRSRSKSVENSKSDKSDQQLTSNHFVIKPFMTTFESTQALRMVAKILNKYKIEEFMRTSSRNIIWKEVTANVEKDFGILVNPREFLENHKLGVVKYVRAIPDPKDRARVFLQQVDDLLPYYDHIAPRSMKKAEFLSPVDATEKAAVAVVDSKKRKEPEDESNDSSSTKSKKRLNSGGESIADSGDIPLTTNTTTPLRTYLKKKTVSDDPKSKKSRCSEDSDESCSGALDFLDEWNTSSNDGLVEQPEEKEPEEKEVEKAPVEIEPPTPVEEPCAPPAPKRRGRKPKDPNAPAPVPKKVMPVRQGTRSMKDTKIDASLPEKPIPDIEASPPVSSSKQLVAASRALTYPSRKDNTSEDKYPRRPPKYKIDDKEKETAQFLAPSDIHRRDPRESEDSEIEDVPLMGTNIRVHTIRGKVEQSKSLPIRGNMNPVVLLDKISTGYMNSLSSAARTNPISRNIQTRRRRGESSETSSEPSTGRGPSPQVAAPSTGEKRKRGRPKKRTRAVPQRSEPTPVVPTSSVELVRQTMRPTTVHSLDRSYIVREIESRPSSVQSRHLMPMSPPSTSSSENLVSRSNPDLNPPEWFERFVMETRRHEMWKVHQLMKMQQELLDSECQKRGVLEKILTALSDRS